MILDTERELRQREMNFPKKVKKEKHAHSKTKLFRRTKSKSVVCETC